ncbi:hypothetical protein DIPPA_19958 [Diplonema papillatum]|nr:hypothetical protein DIPPA_19992 [Diplonema papillatum]KAJ9470305.1 hypothetical protein DIPPA_19958 [Diplonema papillatum]
MRALVVLLLLHACVASGLKVLFVGNSYTSVNNLPAMFESVSESMLPSVSVSTVAITPGGTTLGQHSENAATLAAVEAGDYDVLVLQEQSELSGIDSQGGYDALWEFLPIRSNPSIVFYETWGRKDGDPRFPEAFGTYSAMQCLVSNGYTVFQQFAMTRTCNVSVAPVGMAFERIFQESGGKPGVNDTVGDSTLFGRLYANDKSHPSVLGTFLAATTLFSTIFTTRRTEWSDNIPVLPAGVSEADGAELLRVALRVTKPLPPAVAAVQGAFSKGYHYEDRLYVRGWTIGYHHTCSSHLYIEENGDGTLSYGNNATRLISDNGAGITFDGVDYCVDAQYRITCNGPYWATCEAVLPPNPCSRHATNAECVGDPLCTASLFSHNECVVKPIVVPECQSLASQGVSNDQCVEDYACMVVGGTCVNLCYRFRYLPEACEAATLTGSNGLTLACQYNQEDFRCDQAAPVPKDDCSYAFESVCSLAVPCLWHAGRCEDVCDTVTSASGDLFDCARNEVFPHSCGWDGHRCTVPACILQKNLDDCEAVGGHCLWSEGQCWARGEFRQTNLGSRLPCDTYAGNQQGCEDDGCTWVPGYEQCLPREAPQNSTTAPSTLPTQEPTPQAPAEVTVLFLGNTLTSTNDLPAMFRRIAEVLLPNVTVATRVVTFADATLWDLAADAEVQRVLNETEYDVLVLQEHGQASGLITVHDSTFGERRAAERALDEVFGPSAAQRGAAVVFFETWAHRTGNPVFFPRTFPSFAAMQCRIANGYTHLLWHTAKQQRCARSRFAVAPAGLAFEDIANADAAENESLFGRLYAPDGRLPSPLGSLLAATTLFATVFEDRRAQWDVLRKTALSPAVLAAVVPGLSAADVQKVADVGFEASASVGGRAGPMEGIFGKEDLPTGEEWYVRGARVQNGSCEGAFRFRDINAAPGELVLDASDGSARQVAIKDLGFGLGINGTAVCTKRLLQKVCSRRYWTPCPSVPRSDITAPCVQHLTTEECLADSNCTTSVFSNGCTPKQVVVPMCELRPLADPENVVNDCSNWYACDSALYNNRWNGCTTRCHRFDGFPEFCERASEDGSNGVTLTCVYDFATQTCEQLGPEPKNDCSYPEATCAVSVPCVWKGGRCQHVCPTIAGKMAECFLGGTENLFPCNCAWDPSAGNGEGHCAEPACIHFATAADCASVRHCTWRYNQCWTTDAWIGGGEYDGDMCVAAGLRYCDERNCSFTSDDEESHFCAPRAWVAPTQSTTFAPSPAATPTEAPAEPGSPPLGDTPTDASAPFDTPEDADDASEATDDWWWMVVLGLFCIAAVVGFYHGCRRLRGYTSKDTGEAQHEVFLETGDEMEGAGSPYGEVAEEMDGARI